MRGIVANRNPIPENQQDILPMEAVMPLLDTAFTWIERNRETYLDRLFDYLRLPSISAHGEGIVETAEHIAGVIRGIGLETEILPTAGWPVVLARRSDRPSRPTVLLYGHYDVQPPDPLDDWISPPFEPTVRNGRIYARGVGDNKGQHFANLLAIEALLASLGELPCNVLVLLEGEEEIGSPRLAPFVEEHRDRLDADLVITSDGPVNESGRSCLVFGVRGVALFELRARGARTDLHSGNWGGVAPNPLWRLVHCLGTMKNAQGEITIAGFYDDVKSPTPLERDALDRLPYDDARIMAALGVRCLDAPDDRPIADRLAVWPTLTINGLHGGYAGEGSKTVLPCEAVAKCDIRLVHDQSRDDILAKVADHVRRHAPDIEFIPLGGMDPSKTPLDSPFAEPIRRGITEAQGEDPLIVPALGGSLPDYVFTKILGIPAFGVPYANPDEANHAPNENLEVERFFDGIRTGASILAHLGSMKKPNTA